MQDSGSVKWACISNNPRAWLMEIKALYLSLAIFMLALYCGEKEHILQNSMGSALTGLNMIVFKIFIPQKALIRPQE